MAAWDLQGVRTQSGCDGHRATHSQKVFWPRIAKIWGAPMASGFVNIHSLLRCYSEICLPAYQALRKHSIQSPGTFVGQRIMHHGASRSSLERTTAVGFQVFADGKSSYGRSLRQSQRPYASKGTCLRRFLRSKELTVQRRSIRQGRAQYG